jgi:hypothetical protein
MAAAAGGGAHLAALVAACDSAAASTSGEDVARAAAALREALKDGAHEPEEAAAAVAAGVPRALARLLGRRGDDVSDEALEAALGAASHLCSSAPGAEAFVAAGGLPPTAALLRAEAPAVNGAAVKALLRAVQQPTEAAVEALTADAAAVEALTALLEPPSAGAGDGGALAVVLDGERPMMAVAVLFRLSFAARGSALGSPVSAAIVRAGGVPLAVGLLRGLLEGGVAAPAGLPRAVSVQLVCSLCGLCAVDAAALRAARGAGLLPLAARALVEAPKDPEHLGGLEPRVALINNLTTVSPADDLPPLASQPALLGALADALGLAARAARGGAAAGGCSAEEVQSLTRMTLAVLVLMLRYGAPSSRVAASLARAGSAAHLVRPRRRCLALLAACMAVDAQATRVLACRGQHPIARARQQPSKHARGHQPESHAFHRTLSPGLAAARPPARLDAPIRPRSHHPHAAVRRGPQRAGRRRHGGRGPGPAGRRAGRAAPGRRRRGDDADDGGVQYPRDFRRVAGRRGGCFPGSRGHPAAAAARRRGAGCRRRRAAVRGLRQARRGHARRPAAPALQRLPRPRALVQHGVPAGELGGGPQGGVHAAAGSGGGGGGPGGSLSVAACIGGGGGPGRSLSVVACIDSCHGFEAVHLVAPSWTVHFVGCTEPCFALG